MPHRDIVAKELAGLLAVLAHPQRIRIIEELRRGERGVSAIQAAAPQGDKENSSGLGCTVSHPFEIRLSFRTGRSLVAGLLSCLIFLSVCSPTVLIGLACGTDNFVPASESTPQESGENEWEAPVSTMGIQRSFRRIVDRRYVSSKLKAAFRARVFVGLVSTRARQIPRTCEHDRRNGLGAPLRC